MFNNKLTAFYICNIVKTLLFLHGWGGNRASFANTEPFFAPRFNCLFPEFPTEPPNGRPWALRDYVTIAERQLESAQTDKFSIIAHSFGCRVAVLLALKHPNRFEHIILTGAAGIKPRFRLNIWLKIKLYKLRKKLFKNARGGSPDYRKLSNPGKETFQNIINRDLRPEIKRLGHQFRQIPTLLIWGKKDKSTPLYMAKEWTKHLQQSTLTIYKNSGHFCFIDEPARFTADVFKFLVDS